MRKLLIIVILMLTTVFSYGQSAIVEVEGSSQVCAGFGPANQVRVTVSPGKTPFEMAGKYIKAYIWISEHETGIKIWYSNQPSRWVPIPWSGAYRVHAKIEYILPGRTRPFAVVSSNQVIITGVHCN